MDLMKRILVSAGVASCVCTGLAGAATFTVTKTADTNDGTCDADCSLREAVVAANTGTGADQIELGAGVFLVAIPGTGEDAAATGDLDITEEVTIVGAGPALTVVDGGRLDRVIEIPVDVPVSIIGLAIEDGLAPGSGAGIRSIGDLSLTDVILRDNETVSFGFGGAIWADFSGSLTVERSALHGNMADGGGGALAVGATAELSTRTTSPSSPSATRSS